jgi:ubiquinone/menaquinone biosynthesis C-methylase UbiE
MFDYYDERALEYEEAYTLGTGTSSMRDPEVFKAEARTLAEIVGRFGQGRLIDLACGTGYWLPSYAANCSHITLFDQSARMLDESRKKIARLGIAARCSVIHGDVFEHPFGARAYDCALVGFLLSHVTRPQERTFFDILRAMLEPSGRFLILDSAWSPERAMVNQKEERQERRLNDGTLFEIYKRYYDRQDVEEWAGQYGVTLQIEHFATAFLAVSGYFT